MQGKMAVLGSQAPALQPLRWPHGVRKRCTCRASTFKMAVQGSQALCFNLLDGRTGFSSAAPVKQTNRICKIIVQTKSPTKPTPFWLVSLHSKKDFFSSFFIELNQLYAIRWRCFSANFHAFQGIVGQVHQLYAPRCGNWLGGSLVSALSCVAFRPLPGPFLCFCVFTVLLLISGHSLNDTQDVIMHVVPIAG